MPAEHQSTLPACQLERVYFLTGGQSLWRCGRCGMQARATDKPACPKEKKRDA
jgi:ABC-type ATPase with predicted acetyltransferase domain